MLILLVTLASLLAVAGAWLGIEVWLASYFFASLYQNPPAGAGWDT